MIKKRMMVLAIFFIGLVAISAVSAVENATDEIAEVSQDTENVEIDEVQESDEIALNNEPDDSFEALQKMIDDATENSVVTLESDYWNGPGGSSGGVEINKNLTIEGNGHKLDASGYGGFQVTNGSVVFKDIIFVNGINYIGGGAIWKSGENSSCKAIGCTFENNNAVSDGGALYLVDAENCTFKNNSANGPGAEGGAMSGGTAVNCVFIGNYVIHSEYGGQGGAIYQGNAINCIFKNNSADDGGGAMYGGTAVNCIFINNTADYGPGMFGGTADSCTFEGDWSYETDVRQPTLNVSDFESGCCSGDILKFNLLTNTTGEVVSNRNIHVTVYDENKQKLHSFDCLSDGWAVDLPVGTYFVECNATDYLECRILKDNAKLTITKGDCDIAVTPYDFTVVETDHTMFVIVLNKNVTGSLMLNISGSVSKINVTEEGRLMDGKLSIWLYNNAYPAGQYNLTASYLGDKNFKNSTVRAISNISLLTVELTANASSTTLDVGDICKIDYKVTPDDLDGNVSFSSSDSDVVTVDSNGTVTAVGGGVAIITVSYTVNENYTKPTVKINITVNKFNTQITAFPIVTTYNINKNLVITLKDTNGNFLSNVQVIVELNGSKKLTTDKNGQIIVSTKDLAPKTYTAKITFNGSPIYVNSTKNVTVTVKKATPKLAAKSKKFKKSIKVKKYTVTLKDNTGKAMKKVQLTIKVGKKTFKAKTNNKGKATFKIKKLTKKGKYKATVTFKGDKNYNKVTKKVKITIK